MKVKTTCVYCGVGCQLYLNVQGGQVVNILPAENGPGEGRLCVKGWSVHEFVHHPDRLQKPLIKEGGAFREASWDEALDLVARKLKETKDQYGPDSIGFLTSAKATNEDNYLMQKLARAVIGTNNVDHCARLCHASTVSGLVYSFGSGAMTNSQEDVEESDVIFVIGSNTTEQHPLIARRIIRAVKNGAKLIVADPRRIKLAEYASMYLPLRPGTDVALLNAMMYTILEEGLQDAAFIESKTAGFRDFRDTVSKYSPGDVAEETGVPAERIRDAARIYGEAERGSIFFCMGITQHTTGVNNVVSCANLALLTGNVGREGTGVNPLRGQNNVQGACDVGALPDYLPGYGLVDNGDVRDRFHEHWGVEPPDVRGFTVMEMLSGCGEDVKVLYIMGENPVMSDPDSNHVTKQIGKLDFMVVQELFMSETARMADVVLPAASFAEKDGTYTATDRRIQRVRKAIEPLGESKPDWVILSEVARRLGYAMNYDSPREIMDEIANVSRIYRGVNYGRLESEDLRWPCTSQDHPGTRILHREAFSRGKGRFHPVEHRPPAETPDSEYPYILTTGRMLQHWHTGTMTRRSPTLTGQVNEAIAEINPSDAHRLGIEEGTHIRVSSRRGQISLRAGVTDRIKEGVVFIPFHFAEAAANKLTNPAYDPVAKIPELKVCAVKIEKIT